MGQRFTLLTFCLAGCVSSAPEPATRIHMDRMPFASSDGAQAAPPYLLGWQCSGAYGVPVQELNGYQVFVSDSPERADGLVTISVQPPDWPCAFAALSRPPGADGPLRELAWSGGLGSIYTVFSLSPLLQPVLADEMAACLSRQSDDIACADDIAGRYAGQGVTFAVNFPHASRADTMHQVGFLMRDGQISYSE